MAIDSTAGKNAAVSGLTTAAPYGAVYSAAPTGGAAGAELSGVARQPLSWSAPSGGQSTAQATFSGFANNATVAGAGIHSALTGGTYEGGGSIATRTMLTGDQLVVTYTATIA